ncbi:hypothetical protein Q31a_34010 [Aureliella helgolandensis]|uniref:Uncharacterized protein n=1 Tax=Aureliella helgolandensis TaxID=2527968 RepID=A0A518G941_9BACT|nr:hypothetical protein Q31a_34010 [Aureliella helgolandensis]
MLRVCDLLFSLDSSAWIEPARTLSMLQNPLSQQPMHGLAGRLTLPPLIAIVAPPALATGTSPTRSIICAGVYRTGHSPMLREQTIQSAHPPRDTHCCLV